MVESDPKKNEILSFLIPLGVMLCYRNIKILLHGITLILLSMLHVRITFMKSENNWMPKYMWSQEFPVMYCGLILLIL